jgi:hypothetical protein
MSPFAEGAIAKELQSFRPLRGLKDGHLRYMARCGAV